MANRYPLIVDTTDGNKIKEIPSGDNLQLTANAIIGVTDVTASGTVAAGVLSATSIKKGGTEIATVATTGSYNDLINRPLALSDLTDDLNVLVPGDNVGQLTNNVGYITTIAFADVTDKPTTLTGYGITDAVAIGASITSLVNNAGYVTIADLQSGLVTVDVNSTGDLNGSVFADDSTIMIDGVLAAVNLDGTIRGNVIPSADDVYDLGTGANRFKDIYISGSLTFPDATVQTTAWTGVGDLTGSVFADDSTLLLDGVAGKIVGDVENTEIITTTVQGRASAALNIYRGTSGTVSLGDASSGSVYVSDSGISVASTGGVNIFGAAGAAVDIGTSGSAGDVNIGKSGNTTTITGGLDLDSAVIDWNPIVSGVIQANGLPVGTKFTQPVPTTSIGQSGDVTGSVTFDSSYIYYCTADHDGSTNIWKRVAWSGDTWS